MLTIKFVNANEQFIFNVTEMEILENGNQVNGYKGGTAISEDGSTITADNFFYNKLTNILETSGDVKYVDNLKFVKSCDEYVHRLSRHHLYNGKSSYAVSC